MKSSKWNDLWRDVSPHILYRKDLFLKRLKHIEENIFFRGLFVLVLIFLPPWLVTRSLIFPIRTDESIQQLASTSSTPEDYFDAQLENQIGKFEQLGIADVGSIARYNTTIENDSYLSLFNASGTNTWVDTSTLICGDQGFSFGTPELIASDLDVPDTENILRSFNCRGLTYADESSGIWFSLPPHYSADILENIPITGIPTRSSYLWIYVAIMGLWVGFIIALKEMIHLGKNGLEYFWE